MKKIFLFLLLFISVFRSQWVEQNSGVTVTLTSVHYGFPLCCICGYNGTVLKSTNNGTNWLNISGNGIPNNVSLVSILVVNSSTIVTAGYIGSDTYVYRSTNTGANWAQVFFQTGGFINAVTKLNSGNLFMEGDPVGSRWSLWKSTNSGANWDSTGMYLPQSGSEAGWNNAVYTSFYGVWFGTNNYRIYYSSNSGTSWSAQLTPSEQNSYAIWFSFLSSPAGEGLSGGATMLRASNWGSSWNANPSIGTGNFGGIAGAVPPIDNIADLIWYVRSDNKIYFTSSNASNWVVQYTAPSGIYRYIWGGSFGNGSLWAVRNNGGISFHPPIAGIEPISNEIPEHFSLSQNFPNPFNPKTIINFQLPMFNYVSLKVYDILGREAATLVNQQLKAGTYEADWDAVNYPSGVYYYKLTAGEYSETKKMILLK